MRFAFGVTGCTLALTIFASLMIALTDPPAGAEYLRVEDLQTVGLAPSAFRCQRLLLPRGVVSHQYSADVAGARAVVSCEVRLGESRALFDQAHEHGERSVQVHREAIGRGGEGEMVIVVRVVPFPRGGQVTAETWIREGNNAVRARVTEMDVADDQVAQQRDGCRRQSRTIAMIMHGNVRDAMQSR